MRVISALALAFVLALPAAARAATVSVAVSGSAPDKTLTITLDAATRVSVSTTGSDLTIGAAGDHDTASAPACAVNNYGWPDCGPPSDYALIVFQGTAGDDTLAVTPELGVPIEAHGGAGDDHLWGAAGADALYGDGGDDELRGNGGTDRLEGGADDDVLAGGGGNDVVDGGAGDDDLDGEAGVDTLSGGPGDDTLSSYDGVAEPAIGCGDGLDDWLYSDAEDAAPADCEVIAPNVVGAITVAGTPMVGETLEAALAGEVAGTASTLTWEWWRCDDDYCELASTGQRYALTLADAGSTLFARLTAENDAGWASLDSADVGPVTLRPPPPPVNVPVVRPPAPPIAAPAPRFTAAAASLRSASCAGRRCRVALTISGDAARVQAVLTRAGKTFAQATRTSLRGKVTLTLVAKRALRAGGYRLRVTVTGRDGVAHALTRTLRVRRQ